MLMLSSCRDSHQPAASQYTRNQGRTNIPAPSQIQIHKYILLCTKLQPQLQISTIWYCLYLRWRLRVGLTLFTTLFIASWSCTVHFLLLRGSGKREGGVGGGGGIFWKERTLFREVDLFMFGIWGPLVLLQLGPQVKIGHQGTKGGWRLPYLSPRLFTTPGTNTSIWTMYYCYVATPLLALWSIHHIPRHYQISRVLRKGKHIVLGVLLYGQ